jgi:riboflavin kinase/FMN adenylyltransferase
VSDRPLPRDGRGTVVTVGTFAGVHVGHRAVCDEIVRRAERTGGRSVLVTFHPHPLRVVRPESAPALLTPPPEKTLLLAETGLHCCLVLRFDRALQQYPASRFVEEILLGHLGMTELVMGYDHGFGRGREGSVDTIRELGRRLGFGVDVVDAVRLDGRPVSSTRIRDALARGDVAEAARCLGRPYSLEGTVVAGSRRGRELGFPTANLRADSPDKLLPKDGIYAVHAWVDGERVPGLLHLGPRPVFPGEPPTIEVHLLDWSGDLYDRWLRVDLAARLRDVLAFDSVEALVEQMHRDAALGRALLRGGAAGGGRVVPELDGG